MACDHSYFLDPTPDYFFPIANDVAGASVYNALVAAYKRKETQAFQKLVAQFRHALAASPLSEPVAFLEWKEQLDTVLADPNKPSTEVEKKFEMLVLQYPHSPRLDFAYAAFGNFWLARNNPGKAYPLFEMASRRFSHSPLKCVLHTGVAECLTLQHQTPEARALWQQLLSDCTNERVRLIARLRLADLRAPSEPLAAALEYQSALLKHASAVSLFYPDVPYRLAEKFMEAGKPSQARALLEDYLHAPLSSAQCQPFAYKLLGDLLARTQQGDWIPKAMGVYLAGADSAPHTDMGRLCRILALLLEQLRSQPGMWERNQTEIEKQVESLPWEMRRYATLQMGMTLLAARKTRSLAFLAQLGQTTQWILKKQPWYPQFRESLFQLVSSLTESSAEASDSSIQSRNSQKEIVQALAMARSAWFDKDERFANNVARYLSKQIHWGDRKDQPGSLQSWRQSVQQVFESHPPKIVLKEALMRCLQSALQHPIAGDVDEATVGLLLTIAKSLETVYPVLALAVLQETTSPQSTLHPKLEEQLKQLPLPQTEEIQNVTRGRVPQDIQAPLLLSVAKALGLRYSLKDVSHLLEPIYDNSPLAFDKLELLASLARSEGASEELFAALRKLKVIAPRSQHVPCCSAEIQAAVDHIQKTRNWTKAQEVYEIASAIGKKEDVPTLEWLAGKAFFALQNCIWAIPHFESFLKANATQDTDETAEAHYDLGSCYKQKKQWVLAKPEFERVAKSKYPFWSRMAQSELRLQGT